MEQQLEALRARLELHEVVIDRILARATKVDAGLGNVLRRYREMHSPVVQQALDLQRPPGNYPLKVAPYGGGGLPGASSFAAAAAARRMGPAAPQSPGEISFGDGGQSDAFRSVEPSSPAGGLPSEPSFATVQASPTKQRASKSYASLHASKFNPNAHQPNKELTLRHLRELIAAVYASKAEHDHRCKLTEEPRHTLEQHLYNFLGRRYSLKAVVQEWAQSVFRSIKKFGPREVDVMVFGKILQNRISESYQTVQEELMTTAQNTLRGNFRSRHEGKTENEVESLWRDFTRSGIPMPDCEDVVRLLYNDADADVLLGRLRELPPAPGNQNEEGEEGGAVRYKDFLHVLLNFQMNLAEAFLTDFVDMFRRVDSDGDGIITGSEIEALLSRLSLPEGGGGWEPGHDELCAKLESLADRAFAKLGGLPRATFSECADGLAEVISARWEVLGAISASRASESEAANAGDAPAAEG
eukprot:TRINITY_DN23932_c0_g2_i1.p1 TRINITY_DN23932_c0_g2~~TRINITY_DN23932_c0_g2_i1.p1  ORF type:complete len:548 (+),score=147.14 TRINITY_DN23932_c0_g2_i1:232-1644(+)